MRTDFSEFLTALLLAYHRAAVRITGVNVVQGETGNYRIPPTTTCQESSTSVSL